MSCKMAQHCENFGSFDQCFSEVVRPIACSHFVKGDNTDRLPLAEFTTPDLVRELCSREGVAEITLNRNDSCSSRRCYGPGKILWVPDIIVVRGDE